VLPSTPVFFDILIWTPVRKKICFFPLSWSDYCCLRLATYRDTFLSAPPPLVKSAREDFWSFAPSFFFFCCFGASSRCLHLRSPLNIPSSSTILALRTAYFVLATTPMVVFPTVAGPFPAQAQPSSDREEFPQGGAKVDTQDGRSSSLRRAYRILHIPLTWSPR